MTTTSPKAVSEIDNKATGVNFRGSIYTDHLNLVLRTLDGSSKGAGIDEVKFNISEEALTVKVVDAANVCMHEIDIPDYDWYEFRCTIPGEVGMDVERMRSMLKVIDTDTMAVIIEGGEMRFYDKDGIVYAGAETIDPDYIRKEPDLLGFEFANTVTFEDGYKLAQWARDVKSEGCIIGISRNGISFESIKEKTWDEDKEEYVKPHEPLFIEDISCYDYNPENHSRSIDRNKVERFEDTVEFHSDYRDVTYNIVSVDYLYELFKYQLKSQLDGQSFTLKTGEEFPMILERDLGDTYKGKIDYWLAPRINTL